MAACKSGAVLVSPFIKLSALRRVTELLALDVPLCIVTRWRPEEIAAGVSDLSVADFCDQRQGTRLFLLDNLHSKFYRSDSLVFIGSANLTNSGLGWSSFPNEEILCQLPTAQQWLKLEARIISQAVPATAALRLAVQDAVKEIVISGAIQGGDSQLLVEVPERASTWIPSCRSPDSLIRVYRGRSNEVSEATQAAATIDLLSLAVPPGLDDRQFLARLRIAIQMTKFYAQMDDMASDSPRFGELVRRFSLTLSSSTDRDTASHELQTAIRWLAFFFPDRFRIRVYRYSEHLEKVT
jgi:hypothetical protein